MKLLIVEDEKELATSILAYINNEGFNCDLAPDFDKSIELLNINEYDCALVDIMLPGGSGLDVIIQLKKVQPKCGIIVISAKNSLDDKISGLNL
jgi:DNA-binding response OmpR family regulator